LLIDKVNDVFGLVRGQSNMREETLRRELPGVRRIGGDLTDCPV